MPPRLHLAAAAVVSALLLPACSEADGPEAGGEDRTARPTTAATAVAPADDTFDLPQEQASAYPTAYIARVVAATDGDDLAEGAGEHLVIANNADIRTDMGGWWVEDADGHRLPLGIGRQVDAGAQVRLHTGCGQDTEESVFACLEEEVLDDDGDELRLLDAAGNEVALFGYGTAGP